MVMKEKTLLKIAVISSLIGVLILVYISDSLSPKEYRISNLTRDKLGEFVDVKGSISTLRETPGLYIITLTDETFSIPVIVFKEENLTIEKGSLIDVKGNVIEYNGMLEIQAEEIKSI